MDLIAEWKIVDAKWYEIFAKSNLTKVFRIYLKFDVIKNEVRGKDGVYRFMACGRAFACALSE